MLKFLYIFCEGFSLASPLVDGYLHHNVDCLKRYSCLKISQRKGEILVSSDVKETMLKPSGKPADSDQDCPPFTDYGALH